MDKNLIKAIENKYGLEILEVTDAPRQFVAKTYFIHLKNGEILFVKLIDKFKFTSDIVQSLPVVEQLYNLGFKNINYPIKTEEGKLYEFFEGSLIVIFNYIEAKQTFKFDNERFGELIGQLHLLSNKVSTSLRKEVFKLSYESEMMPTIAKVLNYKDDDELIIDLKEFLSTYEEKLYKYWNYFLDNCQECRKVNAKFYITHGDPAGNVMIDGKGEVFIVDWDQVYLAPAERDVWFLKGNESFLKGYSKIFKDYRVEYLFYKHYIFIRFWQDLFEYIEIIFSDKSKEIRNKNLKGLKQDCFEWLWPLIESKV